MSIKSQQNVSNIWITGEIFLNVHWEKYVYISIQIERDMIVVTISLSILNQMEFYRKEKL